MVMGFLLGNLMPRGDVLHLFLGNAMGLAEFWGVLHGPTPPVSCMLRIRACWAHLVSGVTRVDLHTMS